MESKRFQGFLRFVIPESFRWFYSLLLTTEGSCRLGNSSEWFPENSYRLFPLHRADGLGREVVADAADAGDLGGNAGSDALEQRPVELGHRRRS